MKKIFLSTIGLVLFTVFSIKAQEITSDLGAKPSLAEITFSKEVHDYGTIKKGANGICEFEFKNTGTEPLIISSARGSCGCTVPEWPKEPIKPGATGSIKVKYDTERVGPINKSVTINSNAKTNSTYTIRIQGNIEAPVEEAAPMKSTSPGAPIEKH